jgi:hypothetical protein
VRGREAGCEAGRDQLVGPQRKRSQNKRRQIAPP